MRRRSVTDTAMRPSRSRVRQKVVPLTCAGRACAAGSLSSQKISTSKQSPFAITCSKNRPAWHPPPRTTAAIFMHCGEPKALGVCAQDDAMRVVVQQPSGLCILLTIRRTEAPCQCQLKLYLVLPTPAPWATRKLTSQQNLLRSQNVYGNSSICPCRRIYHYRRPADVI